MSTRLTQEETAFWESLAPLIPEENPYLPPEKKTRVGEPGGPAAERPQETIMDFGQDMDLCNDFVSEALERLETIELQIINLEQSPDDKECIHSIFRPFHTIKGVSGISEPQGDQPVFPRHGIPAGRGPKRKTPDPRGDYRFHPGSGGCAENHDSGAERANEVRPHPAAFHRPLPVSAEDRADEKGRSGSPRCHPGKKQGPAAGRDLEPERNRFRRGY